VDGTLTAGAFVGTRGFDSGFFVGTITAGGSAAATTGGFVATGAGAGDGAGTLVARSGGATGGFDSGPFGFDSGFFAGTLTAGGFDSGFFAGTLGAGGTPVPVPAL
jgi:hypothetical protein